MESGESENWYVRARGRVLGPFTWAQLESLRDRGQVARFDEVSRDRQSWTGADRVDRLFPGARKVASSGSKERSEGLAEFIILDDDEADVAPRSGTGTHDDDHEETPPWYFVRNGTQQGPVWLSDLQRMAESMEIGPETLVWRNGMDQWTPGSEVVELVFPLHLDRPAPSGSAVMLPSGPSSVTPGPSEPASRKSILAIASPIMAVFWLCGLGSLAAIVLGVMALRQIGQSQGTLTGKRTAIAGITLGILGLMLALLVLLVPDLFKGFSR